MSNIRISPSSLLASETANNHKADWNGETLTLTMNLSILCFAALTCVFSFPVISQGFPLSADSLEQPGIPKGQLSKHLLESQIFEGTKRDYWVYVPQQYSPLEPATVMVFQDGQTFIQPDGEFRAPTVFDNLIHKKEIPITIAIFINPGHRGESFPENPSRANNRSLEYDTLNDQYARFLIDEVLPEVGSRYSLTDNPDRRAICGHMSGGICAFTVAWERPDVFRKVVSHLGSFVNIRGGHVYPYLIRKTEPKPIRVFLQGGRADLNNRHGNWLLANQQMAAALAYADYDYRLVWDNEGEGHSEKNAGLVFPDTLRWIWRSDN